MTPPGLAPRRAALALLRGVTDRRESLADQIAAPDGPLAGLPPPERARAQRLATGTLRQLSAIDHVLAAHLNRRPPAPVQATLRLAAFELLFEGTPAHAAGNAAVALTRSKSLQGLVNAVSRRIAATGGAMLATAPPPSLPHWLARPVEKAWGAEAAAAIARAHTHPPPTDLTPRDPAGARALAETLEARLLPTGSLRLTAPGQISALPGYAAGAWWVQDAAAALPVRLLGEIAGARVLDLCAAPGGKTLQLAAAGARVTALDIAPARLARLRENLARTGLSADIVTADALEWQPPAPFDAILLDAPCSATGTLRRHPDLPLIRDGSGIHALTDLQARLLDRAWGWLAVGGRLVYATCSLLTAEGERQAARFRARIPGAEQNRVLPDGADAAWLTGAGGLRLRPDFWPEIDGMDGFYATAFTKTVPSA